MVKGQPSVLLIIAITTIVAIITTFGEFTLGQLAPVFQTEFGVSTSTVGVLASILFAASGIGALPVGFIVDRFSPRVVTVYVVALAAIALSMFMFVTTELGLIFTCASIGAVMAASTPLTNRLIMTYVARNKYARVTGWKSVGPQAGAVLAGLAFGGFSGLVSWRTIVLTVALLMLGFAAWSFWRLRQHSELQSPNTQGSPRTLARASPTRKTRAIVWWLLPYAFFSGGVIASIGAFIPLFATQEVGLSIALGAFSVSLIAAVSVVSRFIWLHYLTSQNTVRMLIAAGLLTAVTSVLLVISAGAQEWVFWAAGVLVGATALGSTPVAQVVLLQNTSPARIGMISAWNGIAMSAGLTFQPWFISVMIPIVGFPKSWLVLTGCGLAAGSVMLIFALVRRLRGR